MVRLDHSRLSKTGFNHIRVYGPLYEIIHGTDLFCLIFKNTDKLFTNDLALLLRLLSPLQFLIETLLGIDTDKVQIIRTIGAKDSLHLIAFILAKKTVIHKYAGQLFSNRFRQHNGCYRRVHTAGQSTEYLSAADFFAD